MNVLVAMSGGVDSSVAAYLLKKEGHRVTGVSFELWDRRDAKRPDICCSIETVELARDVADKLEIEHQTVDVRDAFYRYVIESFCNSYIGGITPNPCILCNKYIKFDFLLKKASDIGADAVATGHYARTGRSTETGRLLLRKGRDRKKDQSYVLYVMKQEELSKTIFPLGGMTKDETRRIAADLGLASATRPESQEICFVGDQKYIDFMSESAPEALKPGPLVSRDGTVLGEHRGVAFYTIGQRKGLGISSLEPHYVIRIDGATNTVVVGSRMDARSESCTVKYMNWISIPSLREPMRAGIKIRSTMPDVPSTIAPSGNDRVRVDFDHPQWAPAPGQSAVFYDGDSVVGGGIIT